MSFFSRGLFVIAGIVAGSVCINYFVLGNPIDIGLQNARLGAWKEGQVRTACFPALISPKQDRGNPQLPAGDHRITWQDHDRMVDMTAALHCYVVTQRNAVCNPDNRAYIVDYIKNITPSATPCWTSRRVTATAKSASCAICGTAPMPAPSPWRSTTIFITAG
jgi:hypothetical protein